MIKTNSLVHLASFFLACLLCLESNGQDKEPTLKRIYLQAGAGAASKSGSYGEFDVRAVLKSNWTASISYQSLEITPKNLPADYTPEFMFIGIPLFDMNPVIKMNAFNLTGGRSIQAGRKTWFITEAGLSFINGETMRFSPQPVVNDIIYVSSNYSTSVEKKSTVGGVLKADFNWAFCPYVALGAGAFANFNSIQSATGFHVSLSVGWMNTKKKHKSQ